MELIGRQVGQNYHKSMYNFALLDNNNQRYLINKAAIRSLIYWLLIGMLTYCTPRQPDTGPIECIAKDKGILVKDFFNALASGQTSQTEKYLINKKEFINVIHPLTPEAVRHPNWSGEDRWNNLIISKRDNAIRNYSKLLKNGKASLVKVGQSSRLKKYSHMIFHRATKIEYMLNGKKSIDNDLMGVIVEKNDCYKILNVFWD